MPITLLGAGSGALKIFGNFLLVDGAIFQHVTGIDLDFVDLTL